MYAHLAAFYSARGDLDQAESCLDIVFEAHQRLHAIDNTNHHHSMASVVYLAAGHVDLAFEHAVQAVERAEDFANPRSESIALTALGAARDARGEHREALSCFGRAIELTRNDGMYYRTEATLGRAAAHLHLGEIEPCRRDARAALETARECGFALLEARARELLASM
ncbi:hypothetical protein GCM10029992_14320 [Glycomyces albus]